ncbi:MAG: hypothetical protein FWF60_05380 [Oscillospiraceae bacterium]|nr:hypothetical protein [Oscillospiraceae bacterium]
MQPIVEFTEYPDYEAYRAYYYFVGVRKPIAWINWLCAYAILPAWTVYYFVRWHTPLWNSRIGISLLLCAVFDIAMIIYVATAPRRGFKRGGHSFVTSRTAFFEEYCASVVTGQNRTLDVSFNYDDIIEVHETASSFYTKHSTKNWGFIPKKFLAPGQVEALRALFARKFGERFKTKL